MAEVSDPQRDFYTALMSQYRGRTLKRGDRSKSTRALQLFLREKGYDIKADGVFGKRTESALREYQKANGLSADGQAGKRTLTKIREGITPRPRERPKAVPRGDFTSPIGFEKEATLPPPSSFRGGPRGDPLPHHTPITMPDGTVLGGTPPVVSAKPPPSFEPEIGIPDRLAGAGAGRMPPAPPPVAAGALPGGSPVSPAPPLPGPPVPPPSPPAPPSALESVPTGVGANQAAFLASQQSPPGGGLSDATEAMMGPAPGIRSPSYPVGAGGARPTPGARPGRLAPPPPPPPMPPMSQGATTPQTIALIRALMAGQGA